MKYIILSLLSAVLLSISWPTYGIPFFIFFALVPLLMMEHEISHFSKIKRKSWAIFGLTYLCFVIWNIVTTGWLYGAKIQMEAILYLQWWFRFYSIPYFIRSFFNSIIFIKKRRELILDSFFLSQSGCVLKNYT